MGSIQDETPLKLIFLPFLEAGHMILMADLAKKFSSYGVNCNIITTPANTSYFKTASTCNNMSILTLTFPGAAVGLPEGAENFSSISSAEYSKLGHAISLLRKPTEDLIRELAPDCIISDIFYPWTVDLANEIQVPRVLLMTSSFTDCCEEIVKLHAPHEQKNDGDLVVLPLFPHKIVMKISQLPKWVRIPNAYTHLKDTIRDAKLKSYGALGNSFPCDEEKEYAEFYNKLTGLKVWNVGPLCLQVTRSQEMHAPIKASSITGDDCWMACKKWLDKKKSNSVLYVSFGSMTRFPDEQLQEIAAGLESSDHDFIWVVRKKKNTKDDAGNDGWSVEEFRKRMEVSNKGFIIENWAPQLQILKHQAIGGMVTHCGWNSILEGVTIGGLPLITWPLFAEQFYNERFVVDVLKIGVAVGTCVWCDMNEIGTKETIGRQKVEAAVREVMGDGEGASKMRQRATELREASKKAVEDGDSSQANLVAFLDELKAKRTSKGGLK